MLSLLSINFINNIIQIFKYYNFDLIPLVFSFFTYAIAYLIFKYQFLDFSETVVKFTDEFTLDQVDILLLLFRKGFHTHHVSLHERVAPASCRSV